MGEKVVEILTETWRGTRGRPSKDRYRILHSMIAVHEMETEREKEARDMEERLD